MLCVKTVPTLTRAGAGIPFKRLLFSRRLRSTVTSVPATHREPREDVNSRLGAKHVLESAGEPRRGGRGGINSANKISVNFDQTRDAYKSKDTLELLRSLVVFKLCSYDFLVDKNQEVTMHPTILQNTPVFWQLHALLAAALFVRNHEVGLFMVIWSLYVIYH